MKEKSQPTVFLTGATGAIGSRILEHYLQKGSKVQVLARSRDGVAAEDRVATMLGEAKVSTDLQRNVQVLEGTIDEKDFGLAATDLKQVVSAAEQFIHSAATTHLGATAEQCDRANILGTDNALALARKCQTQGKLERYAHLSSYAASGTAKGGFFPEDSLPENPAFANEYERSKYAAEVRVREEAGRGLRTIIFRPSVTVGDTKTGRISSFNFFYQVVKILSSGMLSHWPDLRQQTVNIVPVDYVARAIRRGLNSGWTTGKTFHLVSRNGALLHDLFELAHSLPHLRRLPQLVPLPQWSRDLLSRKEQVIHDALEKYLLPYLGDIRLETRNAEQLLELPEISLAFLRRLIEYAVEAGYLPSPPAESAAQA